MADEYHPVRGQRVASVKLERSRDMRHHMTDAERILWDCLRGRQVLGLRFRRQQVLDGFIVDFYCHKARLVVEVDGGAHANQTMYDSKRDAILSANGLHIMRLTNDEVLTDLSGALTRIMAWCEQARANG